jgi:hypothetical protein
MRGLMGFGCHPPQADACVGMLFVDPCGTQSGCHPPAAELVQQRFSTPRAPRAVIRDGRDGLERRARAMFLASTPPCLQPQQKLSRPGNPKQDSAPPAHPASRDADHRLPCQGCSATRERYNSPRALTSELLLSLAATHSPSHGFWIDSNVGCHWLRPCESFDEPNPWPADFAVSRFSRCLSSMDWG